MHPELESARAWEKTFKEWLPWPVNSQNMSLDGLGSSELRKEATRYIQEEYCIKVHSEIVNKGEIVLIRKSFRFQVL